MSEPTRKATAVSTSSAGFVHWHVADDRISFRSDAYGIPTAEGLVVIDPLPLTESALSSFPAVRSIVLTAGCHQRSAWRLRRLLEVPVLAPLGAPLDETPDGWFEPGERPVEGVTVHAAAGPTNPHVALLWEADRRVLFAGDLLMRDDGDGPFEPVPREHHEDYAATRRSVEALTALRPDWICAAHGEPGDRAVERMRAALEGWDA